MQDLIQHIQAGQDLSRQQMASAVDIMMRGEADAEEVKALLLALRAKGESVDEIAGAAQAMRDHMVAIDSEIAPLVDTCGTGGDRSGTFNISTAAAIVTAAAGVAVAKHGNRSITSKTGSADVLESLGINVDADVDTARRCLETVGICFCFAPKLHPSMRHVGPIRKSLGVPTIFNMLGPLCNPAGAPFQVLGVGRPELRQLLAQTLLQLGTQHALVVSGQDGLDELTVADSTDVCQVVDGKVNSLVWTPDDFGIARQSLDSMIVETPDQSAKVIRQVLAGDPGPARDIVVLNAAAAIWAVDRSQSKVSCAERAAAAIDDGRATDLLRRWGEASRS